MSQLTTKNIRTFIKKILFEGFVKENLADVETQISNNDIKIQGEEVALKMAKNRGSYTLDMLPMHVIKYAVEILAKAHSQGSGVFTMPSGKSFEINKKNIENGVMTMFFPNDSKAYKNFIGPNSWALDNEEALNKLSQYLMSDVKQQNTIDRFSKISGEEGVVPSRIKYLLTLYANNPGSIKSFTDFIKFNLANAARGYVDASKTVSLDNKMGNNSDNSSFADMVKDDTDDTGNMEVNPSDYDEIPDEMNTSNNEFGAKLKSFSRNFLLQMARARINKKYLNYFALKTLIVADYPGHNTSAQRNQEMMQMYKNNKLNSRLKTYMDSRQTQVDKNPAQNTYFKEHGRYTYALAKKMMGAAESIAVKEGYPANFGDYLIENLLGMPIKANAILMKIALNDTDKSPMEVMEHMGINRTKLIKMFQKIKMDASELDEIVKKIDLDILEKVLENDNPLQIMKQYKISKKVFNEILLNNGKTKEEAEQVFNSLMAKSQGQNVSSDNEDGVDVNKTFMDMDNVISEDEELLEEDMENLDKKFPSGEDTMWVLNNLK